MRSKSSPPVHACSTRYPKRVSSATSTMRQMCLCSPHALRIRTSRRKSSRSCEVGRRTALHTRILAVFVALCDALHTWTVPKLPSPIGVVSTVQPRASILANFTSATTSLHTVARAPPPSPAEVFGRRCDGILGMICRGCNERLVRGAVLGRKCIAATLYGENGARVRVWSTCVFTFRVRFGGLPALLVNVMEWSWMRTTLSTVCENRAACSLMGAVVFGSTREADGMAFFGRMRAGPMWVRIVRERRSAESVA